MISQEVSRLWEECKYMLAVMDFQITQENLVSRKIIARQNGDIYSNNILLELSINEDTNLLILSVDAVQSNATNGMLCTQPLFELNFIHQLLRSELSSSEENSFRLKHEDYLA